MGETTWDVVESEVKYKIPSAPTLRLSAFLSLLASHLLISSHSFARACKFRWLGNEFRTERSRMIRLSNELQRNRYDIQAYHPSTGGACFQVQFQC